MNKEKKEDFLTQFIYLDLDVEEIFKETYSGTNPNWMKDFHEKAIDIAESVGDYCSIAESVLNNLNDKEWVKKILEDAKKKIKESDDYYSIDTFLFLHMYNEETKWKKKYLKTLKEHCKASGIIINDIDDISLGKIK